MNTLMINLCIWRQGRTSARVLSQPCVLCVISELLGIFWFWKTTELSLSWDQTSCSCLFYVLVCLASCVFDNGIPSTKSSSLKSAGTTLMTSTFPSITRNSTSTLQKTILYDASVVRVDVPLLFDVKGGQSEVIQWRPKQQQTIIDSEIAKGYALKLKNTNSSRGH